MICMLAHINNYSEECIEIACHRIIYLLLTEVFAHGCVRWDHFASIFSYLRDGKIIALQLVRKKHVTEHSKTELLKN